MITVVTGPPCGGKSTWVREHAQPEDLIVCFDTYAQHAGSSHPHQHEQHHRALAGHAYDNALHQLAQRAHHQANAWVIRCAPMAHERSALAELVHADHVLVLAPTIEVALHRAHQAGRGRRLHGVIRGWYERYTQLDVDELIDTTRPLTSRAW